MSTVVDIIISLTESQYRIITAKSLMCQFHALLDDKFFLE